MKAKHSPAPWRVGRPYDYLGTNAIFDANDTVIADASDRSSQATDEQRAANARLMATAPRLLAASAAFLDEFGGDIPKWLQSAAVELREAIAEAEGKA